MRCVRYLKKTKKIWIWLAVERATQKVKGFFVGTRSTRSFKEFSENISKINARVYATDGWKAYKIIDPAKHLIGKAHTYTVERTNRLLRHYLARVTRKSYSVSQSFDMIVNSLYVWVFRSLIPLLIL